MNPADRGPTGGHHPWHLGLEQPKPPALDSGFDARPLLLCQPHLPPVLVSFPPDLIRPSPAPCVIALTISTLFVSSDRCSTHLCCPAVSPPPGLPRAPVDCACGESPRAFGNLSGCPRAPLHPPPSHGFFVCRSHRHLHCLRGPPFCLSPHPDCLPSFRLPVGLCKCLPQAPGLSAAQGRGGLWAFWELSPLCKPGSGLIGQAVHRKEAMRAWANPSLLLF